MNRLINVSKNANIGDRCYECGVSLYSEFSYLVCLDNKVIQICEKCEGEIEYKN